MMRLKFAVAVKGVAELLVSEMPVANPVSVEAVMFACVIGPIISRPLLPAPVIVAPEIVAVASTSGLLGLRLWILTPVPDATLIGRPVMFTAIAPVSVGNVRFDVPTGLKLRWSVNRTPATLVPTIEFVGPSVITLLVVV